jgi:tRNA pseudouridine55 synthase
MTLSEWVQEESLTDGVISLFKPYGIPSTGIVELYKRALHEKVGHGGTLDPLAEGKMILGIGKGTKKLTNFLEGEKRYRATILFGASTDSSDLEWPLQVSSCPSINSEELDAILQVFSKGFTQTISRFSAVKKGGRASFKSAQQGKEVEEKQAETKLLEYKVHDFSAVSREKLLELLAEKQQALSDAKSNFAEVGSQVGYYLGSYERIFDRWSGVFEESKEQVAESFTSGYLLDVEILVPKGTYIRSLATALADKFQAKAVLVGLTRLASHTKQ